MGECIGHLHQHKNKMEVLLLPVLTWGVVTATCWDQVIHTNQEQSPQRSAKTRKASAGSYKPRLQKVQQTLASNVPQHTRTIHIL